MTLQQWEEKFNQIGGRQTIEYFLCCNGDNCGCDCGKEKAEKIKHFISSILTKAIQEERERIKDYLENAKGQYSTEEMRDGYWILEDIISLLNKE